MQTKEKISITLSKELLKWIDSYGSSKGITNRSEVIEELASRSAASMSVDTALIVWHSHHTIDSTHSIFLKLGEHAQIERLVKKLVADGIKNIVMAVSNLTKEIEKIMGDGSKFGAKITYVHKKIDGTALAIKAAEPLLKGKTFLLVSADIFVDFDLKDIIEFHWLYPNLITLALVTVPSPKHLGVAVLHKEKIIEFTYKPNYAPTHLIMAGISVISPKIYEHELPKQLEEHMLPRLAKQGKLNGFLFGGAWQHLKTKEDYKEALNYARRVT